MNHSQRVWALGLALASAPTLAGAVTPMVYYDSLVAGGEAGFRDGSFAAARFREPLGLAFDETGRKLYVADSGNHRIRVIDLGRENAVTTLAGGDSAGAADGPLSRATFGTPARLASLPGNRLAVYDAGNNSIRLIDIQNQTVSTLVKGLPVRDMVYRQQDDSLYLSEPDNHMVEKMDLKTFSITTVFSQSPRIPSPGALCLYQGNLCAADEKSAAIYEVTPANGNPVSLKAVGNAKDALALTSTDGRLYAFQEGGFLARVELPRSTPFELPTPWGFLVKNDDYQGMPFFTLPVGIPPGFTASPTEPRKLFISMEHSIVSVRDYDFQERWGAIEENNGALTDFDYPYQKPAGIFRILAIGPSRNSTAVPLPKDPLTPADENTQSPRVETFPKQLELLLNTEAALRNSKVHFEVLNFTRRGSPISTFAYYDVPDLVKRYDIDLVLGLGDQSGYKDYYERPLTPEGIPAPSVKHEYLLKPLSERAKSGVALDLLERCKKMKIPVSNGQDFPGDGLFSLFCTGDPQIQSDLEEMAGRRLVLLNDKLGSMRTSSGNRPQFAVYYVPCRDFPNDCLEPFWGDLCSHYHLRFLDLSDAYDALKTSYYPTNVTHFTAYGNALVALILSHYLIDSKLAPF